LKLFILGLQSLVMFTRVLCIYDQLFSVVMKYVRIYLR